MHKSVKYRVLGAALACAVGVSATVLFTVPGIGNESPLLEPSVHASPESGQSRFQLAQADAVPVESPVTYSTEQADRGERRYERDCEECHGDDLKGGMNGGAPLRGLTFEGKYFDGLPASVLYSLMSSAMPPDAPGRYSPSIYADLMAYVLKRNGFRAGAPLPSDFEALDYLIMEK